MSYAYIPVAPIADASREHEKPLFGYWPFEMTFLPARSPINACFGNAYGYLTSPEEAALRIETDVALSPVPMTAKAVFADFERGVWSLDLEDCRRGAPVPEGADRKVFLGWVLCPREDSEGEVLERFAKPFEAWLSEVYPAPDAETLAALTFEADYGYPYRPLVKPEGAPTIGSDTPAAALGALAKTLADALTARLAKAGAENPYRREAAQAELALAGAFLGTADFDSEAFAEVDRRAVRRLRTLYRMLAADLDTNA